MNNKTQKDYIGRIINGLAIVGLLAIILIPTAGSIKKVP